MKKSIKILTVLFLLGVFSGAIITVYTNYKNEQKENKEKIAKVNDYYKVIRENNKYVVKSDNKSFNTKKISNIFYDNKNVYLYLNDDISATIIKYNVKKNKTEVLFENNNEITGGISKIGKYYKIGNNLYNNNFQKIKEYPKLEDNKILLSNLKYKIISKDNGISKINLDDNSIEILINGNNERKLIPYLVSDSGNTIIVKDEKGDLFRIDNNNLEILNVNNDYDVTKNYSLLSDNYLLEIVEKNDTLKYNIYDVIKNDKIYSSDDGSNNYKFNGTKLVYEKDNDIIYKDYVTGEEKVLIYNYKNKYKINSFLPATDNYSLLLSFDNDDKSFYIFYM